MARSLWKGKILNLNLYKENWKSSITNVLSLAGNHKRKVVSSTLYRRNTYISPSLVGSKIEIYNGYDFFTHTLDQRHVGLNLSELVMTRELNVTHKVKVSKGAKKNLISKQKKKIPADKRVQLKKKVSLKFTPASKRK